MCNLKKKTLHILKYILQTWDLALARTANAWAKRCLFQHNPFSNQNGASHPDPCFNPPGENLWIGNAFRRPFDPTPSVRAWYSEVDHYNYQNNTCARTCGQYTQVIFVLVCQSKMSRISIMLYNYKKQLLGEWKFSADCVSFCKINLVVFFSDCMGFYL